MASVLGFDHSGIVVRDLEKMLGFYRDDLGLTVRREVDSVAPPEGDHTGIANQHRTLIFVGKPEGGHALELVHYIDPPSPDEQHLSHNVIGAAHICFNVEDLAALHRELTAKGIEFVTAPLFRETPDGTMGICYSRDPEGNTVEFIQPAR